ncbi:MAG: WhiB family transcriptional regulator [Actinomycetota bacterium]
MVTAIRHSSDWAERAICAGDNGSLFYPPLSGERKKAKIIRERRAKNLCAHCPVQADCLSHALRNDERYGIWGGMTDAERRDHVLAMATVDFEAAAS